MQIYKKSTAAEAGENWGLSAFSFFFFLGGYYVAEKFFTHFLASVKSNIENMFPIWKDLSPIEGFYIPYIHLIKCFPLKSYIWPHIGPGRSWRRFLFLSKLVMSPDNSGGEGLFFFFFFPAPFSSCGTWREGGAVRQLLLRNETPNFQNKPFQINLIKHGCVQLRSWAPPPWPCVPNGIFGKDLCAPDLSCPRAVLRARSVLLCRAQLISDSSF